MNSTMATSEKILPGGEMLVRVDGEAVLGANAVPGDVVQVQLQCKQRGVLRADMIEIIRPSERRVSAPYQRLIVLWFRSSNIAV